RFDDIGLICEILHQIERAVEEKQSCFILTPAQYGIEHSRQASHSAKLPLGATPGLHCDHQRYGLSLRRFVEMNQLRDPIIFNNEVLGLQSINRISGSVSHQ